MKNKIIKVPSKFIYDKHNPKVRDNILERVEVGANEVLPNNNYGVSVYNEIIKALNLSTAKDELIANEVARTQVLEDTQTQVDYTVAIAGVAYTNRKVTSNKIYIPILKDNAYIKDIFVGKDEETGKSNIRCEVYGRIKKGTLKSSLTIDRYENVTNRAEFEVSPPIIEENYTHLLSFPEKISHSYKFGFESTIDVEVGIGDNGNLDNAVFNKEFIEGIEYYVIDLEALVSFSTINYGGHTTERVSYPFDYQPLNVEIFGEYEVYEPEYAEFTFKGDTIGVSLNEKTVYINGETAKKVKSFEGNELMQVSNYKKSEKFADVSFVRLYDENSERIVYEVISSIDLEIGKSYYYNNDALLIVSGSINGYEAWSSPNGAIHNLYKSDKSATFPIYATKEILTIQSMYGETQTLYSKGKETATIRCSISDYYDYLTNDKVISTDGTTNKMSFDLYDIVVPMIYKGGVDVPMSLKKDGTAKAFSVLGSKIYYDGAVWQELTLQEVEVDTSTQEGKEQLVSPTITLSEEELEISFSGEVVESYDIFSNGSLLANVEATGEFTIVNLSDFNLTQGSYEITVVSKANGYLDSNPSNIVYYVVEVPDMIIEDIYMSGSSWNYESEYGEGILYYSPNSVETDNDGNTVFVYETLALKIISTGIGDKQDLTPPVLLKKGQKITFYPFYMDSQEYEESLAWKYTIVIPEKTRGKLTYYSKTKNEYWDLWSEGSIYWGYEPITIAFEKNAETGIDKITAKDSDGMGSIATDADFDYGVTIEVFERNTTFDNVQYVTQQTYNLLRRNLPQETISFTVDNEIYYAEKDMTWEQWVVSEYNTNGYIIVDGILKNPINRMNVGGLLSNEMYIVQTAYDIIRPFAIYNAVNNFIGG